MVRGGRSLRLLGIVRLAVALLALVTTAPAWGGDAPPPSASAAVGQRERVAVLRFFGPGAAIVRGAVMEALLDGGRIDLPPTALVEAQIAPGASVWAQASEVARSLGLEALVHGYTRKVGRVFYATVTVLAGDDGTALGELNFSARTLPRLHVKIQTELWARVRPLLDHARATAPPSTSRPILSSAQGAGDERAPTPLTTPPTNRSPAPRDQDDSAQGEEDESEVPAAAPLPPSSHVGARTKEEVAAVEGRGSVQEQAPAAPPSDTVRRRRNRPRPIACSMAELELGGGVLMRSFDYRGEERGALRAYTLRRAPVGRVEGILFPFARACGVAGAFGVRLAYERMSGVQSTLADRTLSTTAFSYQAELVGRIRLGRWVVMPAAGYYVRSYGVEQEVVPKVSQHAVGASLDAQLRLGIFVLELAAGARRPFEAGQIDGEDWFPGLTAMTYVGRLRVGGAMTDWLDVLLGVYAEYTALDFHIDETLPYPNGVAAGAHDAYLSGLVSFRLHLPGGGSAP